LIITCAECATQFQLDEARVPASGIRVRCSVCKHAFFVGHPDALDDEAYDPVARVAREVLDAEPGGVPEPTADLETLDASAGPGGSPDEGVEEEGVEESWEFGDGGRLSDAASRDPRDLFEESFEAAREAVDDLLGSPWQAPEPAPASSRVDAEDAPPDEAVPSAGVEPPARDDEPPGLALSDDPWEAPAWSDGDAASAAAGPDDVASRAPHPLASDASFSLGPELREADEMPALDEALPDADDLEVGDEGDPFENEALDAFETAEEADLDLFEAEPSSPDPASDLATPEDWGLDASSDREGPEQAEIPALARSEATVTAPIPIGFGPPLELEPRRGSVLAWLVRAGNGLGWGAVAILAAVALWGSVAPRSAPAHAPGSQALAGLEATGVAGRWVENATLGSLYVVSGELHNPGSETKVPGARLVVRLLDAQGVPVEEAATSLGPPLGALLLREGRPEDLREIGEAGALDLARTAVAPGSRIRFEAVVLDLPDTARRFDLAAAR